MPHEEIRALLFRVWRGCEYYYHYVICSITKSVMGRRLYHSYLLILGEPEEQLVAHDQELQVQYFI